MNKELWRGFGLAKISKLCRGAVAQSVERPKGPSVVQLYLTDVGSNPERDIPYHLFHRHKVVGIKKS